MCERVIDLGVTCDENGFIVRYYSTSMIMSYHMLSCPLFISLPVHIKFPAIHKVHASRTNLTNHLTLLLPSPVAVAAAAVAGDSALHWVVNSTQSDWQTDLNSLVLPLSNRSIP